MATLVHQSRVCKVGVSRVWDLVKNLTFKYLPDVQDCKKDSDDVGSTRTLHFKDKTAQTIKIVDISELDRRLGWDLISSTPSVSVLSTAYTLQLRAITESNWTLIELTTQFSTDATPAVIEDARFKQQDHLDAICKSFVKENERITYPETRRIPVTDVYHGHSVIDPYRWLEDPDSDATKAWVDEQNKITNEHLQEKCPLRHRLKHRLTELFNYERYGCPFKRGARYFFFKNDGLQNQSVLYKQESLEGKAEVLLDPNVLEKDGTASLGVHSLSETGTYFAYGVSRSGSDWQTIFVKNVDTLKDFPEDKIEWVKFSGLSWTHDDKGFFYSRYPTPKNFTDKKDENFKRGTETDAVVNQTVWFHALGTPQSQDVKVFELPNEPKWMTSAEVSHDGRYVLLSIADSCDPVNRLFYFDLQACDLKKSESIKIVKLVDNFDAQYDYVTNEGPLFYFKTNLKAPKYKVICIDITKPDPKNWKEIIPQTQDVLQYVVNANGDWLIANYMQHVKEILKLFNLKGEESKYELKLPTIGSIQGMNARKSQSEVFYKFTSFLYPGTIFRFDLKTPGTAATVFRETRLKGFDPKPFTVEQVFYPSKDGTKIPMFLVYKKNLPRDGKQPVFLYGYGGFNISLEPAFDVRRLAFVQHLNGILAIPNLRGGGEYGEEWHKGGTLLNKQNVFDDFIAAAEYLVANKYTSPSKIAIHGGSNGGLLVAAVTNQRPDLFGCAVAAVGVLDMLRFHKFTIGYAWCSDYGCSDNKEQFGALMKYSPVHNVRKGKPFPAVLLTTADHDDRVVPLHSYKYIATLQAELGNESKQVAPLLIRIETKAGHGAGKPITKVIEEQADMYGFVASHINATWFE